MQNSLLKTSQIQAPADYQLGVLASKPRVLLLRGGPSAERDVSLASGQGVKEGLVEQEFDFVEADIGPEDTSALDRDDFEVVFPVLHGTFGEDGQLQELLEKRGLFFAGSDSKSSRLAMDKYRAKAAFRQAGLLTPEAVLIRSELLPALGRKDFEFWVERATERIGLPCVVKPNQQGSSIGVTIATDENQVWQAVQSVLTEHGDCLLERLVCGTELTVGILGERALPVLHVRPAQGFYDYYAKYVDNNTQYLFDMDLPEATMRAVEADGLRAFQALGCRDFGRVDMILDPYGRDFILEVNTIPGFTSHSLLPKAARRMGLSMGQLCREIVRMAYERSI